MASITPEQAVVVLHQLWIPAYANEHPLTKGVIASIPADRADYRPDTIAKSAIDLAWHIVGAEHRFLDGVASGAFDYGNSSRPESVRTPMDVVHWYSEKFAADIERLKTTTSEQLLTPIDFRGLFKKPAILYLQSGLSHTIHHRGQLSMYLRPIGAKVPSIYGESFDAREARERAQTTSG
jgi:uncharacterized damage-inducible protein DinB